MAYDRDRQDRDRTDRDRAGRDRWGREDRGAFERAGDEVRSWFGDDEARHRRERDERERNRWQPGEERWRGGSAYGNERSYSSDRPYGDRGYGAGDREQWSQEPTRSEGYREYADRHGRAYTESLDRDRDRDIGSGPAFQAYARGSQMPMGRGSQEFGPEGYGLARGSGAQSREWRPMESWRVPGPHSGRGPKGYQRSDERIREELSDRLTAHGRIDASDIEVRVQGAEVTLIGFVDSRDAKREAEDVAEDVQGVREVHNQLRVRSHADTEGVGRTSVLGLTEQQTQNAETARRAEQQERQADAANRSRARNP